MAKRNLVDRALALAADGFRVFPIKPGKKFPPLVKWREASSADPRIIESWWQKWPNANIGIDTGKSGLLVVDVDVKDGKDGQESLDMLELEYGELNGTPRVISPTGSTHYYFRTTKEIANSQSSIGRDIDVRASGGYVVGPGSVTERGRYKWDHKTDKIPNAPRWLEKLCAKATSTRDAEIQATTLDTKENLSRGTDYLRNSAPVAIEGDGGDLCTFKVACRLKDIGLSAKSTLKLMLSEWNDRCEPPWEPADLKAKVSSAYRNSQNAQGSNAADAEFDVIEPGDDEGEEVVAKNLESFCAANLDLINIPKRDWVLYGRLISGYVTLTVAPGGTGKSLYTMLELLAVATGRPLTGIEPEKTGRVLIYNTEDPLDEVKRRLVALALLHNIPMKELRNVYIQSGLERPLKLAAEHRGSPRIGLDADLLEGHISEFEFVAVSVDPLVRAHRLNENDNTSADVLMQCVSRVAQRANCAISLVHHTAKNRSSEQLAGNIDFARGASAFVNAARIASTLTTMDKLSSERLGVGDVERGFYLRLDNAKSNMAPPDASARWFKKVGVNLNNGDNVGAIQLFEMDSLELEATSRDELEKMEVAQALCGFVKERPKTLNECAAYLLKNFSQMYGGRSQIQISRVIKNALLGSVELPNGVVVYYVEEQRGKGKHWIKADWPEDGE